MVSRRRTGGVSGFEHHSSPLLPWPAFRARLAGALGLGLALIAISLAGGMLGYRFLAGQTWPDAFLNAAMILSGILDHQAADVTAAAEKHGLRFVEQRQIADWVAILCEKPTLPKGDAIDRRP